MVPAVPVLPDLAGRGRRRVARPARGRRDTQLHPGRSARNGGRLRRDPSGVGGADSLARRGRPPRTRPVADVDGRVPRRRRDDAAQSRSGDAPRGAARRSRCASAICPTCSGTWRRCRRSSGRPGSRRPSCGAESRPRSTSTASSGKGSTAPRWSRSTCPADTAMPRTSSTYRARSISGRSRSASVPGSGAIRCWAWSGPTTSGSCTTFRRVSPTERRSARSASTSRTPRRTVSSVGAASCVPPRARTCSPALSRPASTSRRRVPVRNGGSSVTPSRCRRSTAAPTGRSRFSPRRGRACSRTRRTTRSAVVPRTTSRRRCWRATPRRSTSAASSRSARLRRLPRRFPAAPSRS